MMMTIEVLKKVLEKIPEDFDIEFKDNNNISHVISDEFEVNVSEKKLMLKSS